MIFNISEPCNDEHRFTVSQCLITVHIMHAQMSGDIAFRFFTGIAICQTPV